MSEELEEALFGVVKRKMPEYKQIVMKAYETRKKEILVSAEMADNENYRYLVKADIFSTKPKLKTVKKKEYLVLKLTDKGKEIGEKLWNEPKIELLNQ